MGEWYTKIWFINGVDDVNWPPYRDWKADVSSVSPSSERIEYRSNYRIPVHYCILEAASFEERGISIHMQISGRVFCNLARIYSLRRRAIKRSKRQLFNLCTVVNLHYQLREEWMWSDIWNVSYIELRIWNQVSSSIYETFHISLHIHSSRAH